MLTNCEKHVLVVEDDENIRKIIKKNLENNDFKVYEAKNGQEGLDIYRMYEEKIHFEVIVLDVFMPVMNGYEFLEELRKINKKIPVIIFSNANKDVLLEKDLDVFEIIEKSGRNGGFKRLIESVNLSLNWHKDSTKILKIPKDLMDLLNN